MGVCDPPGQALCSGFAPSSRHTNPTGSCGANVIIRVIADRMGITPQTVTRHWDAASWKIRKIEWEGR
jgi:hypothetical protein